MPHILFLAVLAAAAAPGQQDNGMVVTLPAPEGAPAPSGSGRFRQLDEPRQDEHKAPPGFVRIKPPPIAATMKFKPGPVASAIELQIADTPEQGDTLSAVVTTGALKVVFVLPDGRRINGRKSAEAAGFSWSEYPLTPTIGSSDGGHVTAIDFSKRGVPGRYLVELTARELTKEESVKAHFVSKKQVYFDTMRQLPGALMPPAVALGPSASITLDVKQDEKGALLDIVVPDANVRITLTLPDGRTLRAGEKHGPGVDWKTVAKREELDSSGAVLFSLSGYLLPVEGTHHVVSLELAAHGRYEIRVTGTAGRTGELRAGFIPIGRWFADADDELRNAARAAPGKVRIETYKPGAQDGRVGQSLEVEFAIEGDVERTSLQLEVKFELRPSGAHPGDDSAEPGPPQVVPVKVTAGQDGHYHGTVIPRVAGPARLSIRASGTKTSGEPFHEEVLLPSLYVSEPPPLVGRFLSLTAKPVDTNGNGKFERLDVLAMLDVVVPGKYFMVFRVADAASKEVSSFGAAALGKGRQQITLSISARDMRHRLKDGPYSVLNLRIYRGRGNFGDDVAIPPREFHTAALKQDQWEPDPIFGDDHATIRGIRPAPSGRFQFAEVEWNATTPGGPCSWRAQLIPASGGHAAEIGSAGKLAAGQSRLRFVFPGPDIALAGSRELFFVPTAVCGDVDDSGSHSMNLTVDPAQFEPPPSALRISAQNMLRLRPGGSDRVVVDVPGKKRGDVLFKVTSVPAALSAFLDVGPPQFAAQADIDIEVSPRAPAGRYFIGVSVTSAGQAAATELVVDVIR